jgi:beta-glucosidase
VAVVCVGLPDGYENEGDDRAHLRLPPAHDALVAAIAAVHDRVVVVLSNGAPVELPWVDDVAAVVEGYLGGQAGGGGLADVLTGRADPGGRLAETFPRALVDDPGSRRFPEGPATVEHREGLYVGYRFHDTVGTDVAFPFGHGLSYTTFEVDDVRLDRATVAVDDLDDGGAVTVSARVTNTGERAGSQVVQVYVRDLECCLYRPDRELRGFAKVHLDAGAAADVEVVLDRRAFAFFDVEVGRFVVEPGTFEVLVGGSSRQVWATLDLEVEGEPFAPREQPAVYRRPTRYLDVDPASFEQLLGRPLPPNVAPGPPFDRNTPLSAVAHTPAGRVLVRAYAWKLRQGFGDDPANAALVRAMLESSPLRTLTMGGVSLQQLDAIVDLVNGRYVRGGRRLLSEAVAALRGRMPGSTSGRSRPAAGA